MTLIPDLERDLERAADGARRRRARKRVALVGVPALLLCAVVAVALSRSEPDSGGAPSAGVPDSVSAIMGVYRRPATDRDVPTDAERRRLLSPPTRSDREFRRAPVRGPDQFLWVRGERVCASWGNCVEARLIAKLGIAFATSANSIKDARYTVSGMVRDGIDQVQIVLPGSDLVLLIRRNAFHAELGDLPQELIWRDSRGHHRERLRGLGSSRTDAAEIRQLVKAFEAAAVADDAEAVCAALSPGGRAQAIYPRLALIEGRTVNEDQCVASKSRLGTGSLDLKVAVRHGFHMRVVKIDLRRDTARARIALTAFRRTWKFERTPDGWRIAYFSIPARE